MRTLNTDDAGSFSGPVESAGHHLSLSRYKALQESAPLTNITLADVRRLAAAMGGDVLPSTACPRERLIAGIDRRLIDVVEQRARRRADGAAQVGLHRGGAPSEVRVLENVRLKVDRWSPDQCRSVLVALAFLRGRRALPIEITPATMHEVLRNGRDASGWIVRPRSRAVSNAPWWLRLRRRFAR